MAAIHDVLLWPARVWLRRRGHARLLRTTAAMDDIFARYKKMQGR